MKKSAKLPKTIDDYLALQDPVERKALRKLRRDIRAAAPGLVECISYGIPAFRADGKMLVAFGASAKHLSFYLGSVLQNFKGLVTAYSTSKGTIRFSATEALPSSLVRKLVKARVSQRQS